MNNFIFYLINIICMLISVAFLTLLERKLLSYIQFRKGPNKISLMGILQPISDAIKLFTKENLFLKKTNMYMYYLSPMMGFFLCLLSIMIIPNKWNMLNWNFSILFMMSIMMFSVYSIMFSGWSSGSNYSMLGALRAISQSLSYEISFSILLISNLFLIESFNMESFFLYQKKMMFMIMMFPLFIMFYISIIAELNRSPFDLVEGESELVSGFNTEYMSGSFALLFLTEYSFIIFYNYVIIIMFMGLMNYNLLFFIMLIFMNMLIIFIRGICPRIRYDQLMYFCWLKILPFSLIYLMFIMMMKLIFIYISLNSLNLMKLKFFKFMMIFINL